ncbi:MAG TPA: PKD domain-containing protein [Opitutaceae bacterium]|nr:PKD domain-containing protein [Opitutaceae bacterium]
MKFHASGCLPAASIISSVAMLLIGASSARAFEKPNITYQVYQFPADQIPRVDGNADDWAMVPDNYAIGIDQFSDDLHHHDGKDHSSLDVRVRIGWVKGLNRLYFLYEATDNYWDFSRLDLHNDTFEIVVDGDGSGGPLLDKTHKEFWNNEHVGAAAAVEDPRVSGDLMHYIWHGVTAQNYHIFTPSLNKDWCMAWGSATWTKDLPWANAAQSYAFKPGESGKYVLEFWITPFDYAGPEGPQRAVESILKENKLIGIGLAVIDYDDPKKKGANGFWNISPKHTMYGDASELCAFRLMPLESKWVKPIEAQWSWKLLDLDRRQIAFQDHSTGKITKWHWDFGDGAESTEQNPIHSYAKPDNYVVVLSIEGPEGKAQHSKVWDIQLP